MKLAKKTISVALAGIMAVSSLAVGTSVFAATNKVNELKSSTKATATFKCDANKTDPKKFDQTVTLYSFKPSESGLYDVTFSSTPYALTKNAYKQEADSTTTEPDLFEKDRLDNATLAIFTAEDADKASLVADSFKSSQAVGSNAKKQVLSFVNDGTLVKGNHSKPHVAGSYSHVATGFTATEGLTWSDLARTEQVKLDKNTTYYIAAVADPFDTYRRTVDNKICVGEQINGGSTNGTFTISKSDWKYTAKTDFTNETEVGHTKLQPVAGTTDRYWILESTVEYVGDNTSIVMPDEYPAGYKAVEITGDANKNVTSVKLGKNCKIMNLHVSYCKKLVSFTYNDLIEQIGEKELDERVPGVFQGCTALKTIVIPKSVKTIGERAFAGCVSLASITLNEGLETVCDKAFYDTAALAVKVPSTVTEIGNMAFGFIEADNDFYVDPYNHDPLTIVNPKFVLGGTTDYVRLWAQRSDVPYVDLTNGCTHHYISYVKVAPTFFSTGSIVKACGFCGVSTTQVLAKTKPAIKAVKSTGKGKIKVYANKTAGVSGYQIKVSTSKKFTKKTTKVVTVKERDSLRKTVKGLKRGKKVYVKIRAYKKSGSKKTYSAFSPVKTVKVK